MLFAALSSTLRPGDLGSDPPPAPRACVRTGIMPPLAALVRAGATLINGKLAERPGEEARPEAA